MIIKELLTSENDFKYWNDGYSFDILIPSDEEEPKQYPCVVVYKFEETSLIAKDIVYYDFVYLNDFQDRTNVFIEDAKCAKKLLKEKLNEFLENTNFEIQYLDDIGFFDKELFIKDINSVLNK